MSFYFEQQEQYLIRGDQIEFSTLASLKNWYPITIDRNTKQVFWRDLGIMRFTAPFFHMTLANQSREEQRTCITNLLALAEFRDSIAPSAFIFHISRCGSTLITQMLSDLAHCIVLSEPPILDAFFRTHRSGNENDLEVFRQLINVLGQKRFPEERHLIIKFDCWHIANINFVRRAFPNVPIIFLYRNPHHVLTSHQRQRGPQMIPNFIDMVNLQIDSRHLPDSDFDAYTAQLLDQFFIEAIKESKKNKLNLVNYNQLPKIVWEKLLSEFQINCSMTQLNQMQQRSQFHSKNPGQNFQQEENYGMHDLDHTTCMVHYLELEALRTGAFKTNSR